jgi:hypothetical protein
MANNEKKQGVFSQIIVAVAVALLVGGTSPWWFNAFFNKDANIRHSQKPEHQQPDESPGSRPIPTPPVSNTPNPEKKPPTNDHGSNNGNQNQTIIIPGNHNKVNINNSVVNNNYYDNDRIAAIINEAIEKKFSNYNEMLAYLKKEIGMIKGQYNEGYFKELLKLIALGDLNNAEKVVEKSLRENERQEQTKPYAASDAYLLGLLKEINSNSEEALKYYQKAEKLDPFNNVYQDQIDRVKDYLAKNQAKNKVDVSGSAESGENQSKQTVNAPSSIKIYSK